MLVAGGDAPLFGGFDKSEILMSTALKKKPPKKLLLCRPRIVFTIFIYVCESYIVMCQENASKCNFYIRVAVGKLTRESA